ncbi:midasin-like [Babylonia areolata]|uniref:midasin-like n=1 Tax=Babylonia areolata TaxID=304850 RepID=UPI003FD62C8F
MAANEPTERCELTAWNIFKALDLLCKNNATCSAELRTFLAKQIWNVQDRETVLTRLSKLFLHLDCVVDIGCYFRPLVLDIASRTKKSVLAEGHANVRLQRKLAVALGMVLPVCPELERFTGEFINVFKPFSSQNDSEEPRKKKSKVNKIASLHWCIALHNLATHLRDSGHAICIKVVADYLADQDTSVRWYAAQAYCCLTGMAEEKRSKFLRQYFTLDEEQELVHKSYQETVKREQLVNAALGAVTLDTLESRQTHTRGQLLPSDLDSGVVSVTGIILPRLSDTVTASCPLSSSSSQPQQQWVEVPSMQDSLHTLALAVSAGRPVLVQGPVGCGKTLLVQHLATLTGRQGAPHLIKVQLGDQTDSKALLGTYQCTEIPGQFVWRAGVLTEAVTKGYWVLLEDLDHAPMEVVSTLAPLLHTSTLSLPGHGDLIQAAPGFQLFATQRLFASGDGLHSQNRSSAILDKLWTQVTIQPLSRAELRQVIVARFPNLPPVVDRLLDIYFMLSAGRHHLTSDPAEGGEEVEDGGEENTAGKFLSLSGRLISTRDLMSWCSCVSSGFVATSPSSAELILQAAVDCFVSCLPCPARRLALTQAVATHLSLTETTAEYFLCRRLPQVEESTRQFTVGSVVLPCKQENVVTFSSKSKATFSFTRPSVCLLEKVAACVKRNEPVLLVGETGTGKTSSVQFLAQTLGHKLHVINLNQQSDSVDLLGGFKPVDMKFLMMPLREEFEKLFCKTFSRRQNVEFFRHMQNCFTQKRWHYLLTLMEHSLQGADKLCAKKEQEDEENKAKWQKQRKKWHKMGTRIKKLKAQVEETENVLVFSFIEGTLVKALKAGDWVLLDEINLAAAETLQCLAGLLEATDGSLVLTDRGNLDPVVRHPDFRLFACMNPATDVGKKDLTPGVRNRFTEFYVDELVEPEDLRMLVGDYLSSLALPSSQLKGIVKFYTEIRQQAATRLVDGTGHKPHYSLRTLCRALRFIRSHNCGTVARSVYEGFCLSFLTQLDRTSHPVVTSLVCQHVLGKAKKESILRQPLPCPSGGKHLQFCDYWISQGSLEPHTPDDYIITPSVKENLKDLARVVSAGSHPVLLQGETSVGKTSLITWLARSSGNHCVRVNNHEHTDLQEYVGCYAADESGKLVFKDGVLVEAMRKGYWIILDELNLAPTDVLEALNRLLDDNQELFIPETQEMVRAHPKFMLFATQNPPGHYGGRKMLSRAFRNRFVELHFDEIPKSELETILHQRCGIPPSYAKRLVAVMLDLQVRRHQTGLFAGKQSWMTLRDLFRWAERYKCPGAGSPEVDKSAKFYNYDQHMADHGYMLLAGRVRKPEEVAVIQEVIEKHFKQCTVNPERLFTLSPHTSPTVRTLLQAVVGEGTSSSHESSSLSSSSYSCSVEGFEHVVWTESMRRLAVLIGQAIQFGEPILLVGDTGCGKTTVCQLYAALKAKKLHSVNCHMHTESADFLGGLRPIRSHSQEEGQNQKLFEWVDGPLVTSMKEGSMFLIDEISLADDSVLERLNSVLELEKSILLAEKGGGESVDEEVEVVKAAEGFQVFATMNPGGDFGKKELSPALRNRFTEIWCPQSTSRGDLISIIEHNVRPGLRLSTSEDGQSGFGVAIMDFVTWFSNSDIGKRCTVSIRDILSWVRFINTCTEGQEEGQRVLDPADAYIHGACLVFLDSLGVGMTSRGSDYDARKARSTALTFLQDQVMSGVRRGSLTAAHRGLDDDSDITVKLTPTHLSIAPFSLARETSDDSLTERYAMQAPTTCLNAQRILKGLMLSRPLLLEGAPGVGKTSLVAAVARLIGRELVRINLSEQTDVTDLFGADLPVEGGTGGSFAWRDGPFLQALKAGHWVVFDEMNLASQSVLEGLNACLDHRGEVFVPELGRTFHIQHARTRIFACQNPLNQGGGRKGLPRSFLNRFTQVYVEPLTRCDLIFICTAMYPTLPHGMLVQMIDFNMKMHEETMVRGLWGHRGAPWEFNLRDINRWCDLMLANQAGQYIEPGEYVGLLYQDRMRTLDDKARVAQLFAQTFGENAHFYQPSRTVRVGPRHVQAGHAFMQRQGQGGGSMGGQEEGEGVLVLHHSLGPLESLMTCVNMGWMAILVGSSSSGKSSTVRLLAELSGHTLHVLPMSSAMDTTELLGGFEQADIGRHVAELTAQVEEEVRCYQQQRSAEGDVGAVGVVTGLDQRLADLREHSQEDVEEDSVKEKEALSRRLKKLQKLVAKLIQLQPLSERLTELLESVKREQEAVDSVQPGASSVGGGAFEWVDSLLVKALRHGHWLLIDNVNFCSPSVLDRLNALLEPSGVLTINERGVTNGTVPTITPHPDFRLFLSMDPKFGEISRAMRNRGVEICILGEGDSCPYSDTDTLSMMQGVGLHSQMACDWLMTVHRQLRERLAANEKPGLCDLLRCAMQVKQQQEKGVGMVGALKHATQNVYVRNMKSLAARQMVCTVLSEEMRKLEGDEGMMDTSSSSLLLSSSSPNQWVDWSAVAPSVVQFQNHSGLTAAQQAARVFVALLSEWGLEKFCQSSQNSVHHYMHGLQTAFSIFLAHQSVDSRTLAFSWLKAQVDQRKKTIPVTICPAQEARDLLDRWLSKLLQVGESFLETLCTTGAMREVCLAAEGLCGKNSLVCDVLRDMPWDCGTNLQAIYMAEMKMLQLGKHDASVVADHVHTLMDPVCKLELLLEVEMLMDTVRDSVPVLEKLCEHASRKRLASCQVLVHLSEVLRHIVGHLPDWVMGMPRDSLHLLIKEQERLLWLPRLLEESTGLGRETDEEVYLSHLALHWNWCWHQLLVHLVTPDSPQVIHFSSNALNSLLDSDRSAAWVFLTLWSALGQVHALPTETAAKLWRELRRLTSMLVVDGSTWQKAAQQKLELLVTPEGRAVRRRLAFVGKKLMSGDFDVESDLSSVREVLLSYRILRNETGDVIEPPEPPALRAQPVHAEEAGGDKSDDSSVRLWPVFEHLGLLSELYLLSVSKKDVEAERRLLLQDFAVRCSPSAVCYDMFREQDFGEGERMRWVLKVLQRVWTSPAVSGCALWLDWGSDTGDSPQATDREVLGPAMFHRSSLLLYLSHLLMTSRQSPGGGSMTSQYDLLPLTVTLGGLDSQMTQLTHLSCHLWKHAGVLSSDRMSFRKAAEGLLVQNFLSLLNAVTPLIDGDWQEQWASCLAELSPLTATTSDPQDVGMRKRGSEGMQCMEQMRQLLREHCAALWQKGDNSAMTVLDRCLEVMLKVVEKTPGKCSAAAVVGEGVVWVGQAWLYLLAPKGRVDPVHKANVELRHHQQELCSVEMDIQVWEAHLQLTTGQTIADVSPDLRHPRLDFLVRRQDELKSVIADLEKRQAFREDCTQYLRLRQDVETILETVGSMGRVSDLLSKLRSSARGSRTEFSSRVGVAATALKEERTWQHEAARVARSLSEEYPCVPDLTVPLCLALEQMRFGMRILQQEVSRRLEQHQMQYWPDSSQLDTVVTHLSAFPSVRPTSPTWLHLASTLTSPATCQALTCLLATGNDRRPVDQALSGLLSSSLHLVKLHAQQTGELTSDLFLTLTNILSLFVKAWQDQEDQRRQKEEEEAALFRYKDRTHGEEKTEEEKEEEAFRRAFPSYRDDYSDMIEATRLEDIGVKEKGAENHDDATAVHDLITEQHMDDICTNHMHLLHQLTSAMWLPRQQLPGVTSVSSWEVLKPALLAYQVAMDVGKKCASDVLSEQVDRHSLGSHLVVCGTLVHSLKAGDTSQVRTALCPPAPRCYNVYVDPNVEEVMACRRVLRGVEGRVRELQEEWPSNPILTELQNLVERIESFSIMSPVIKFLTGMELLLEKAQHWEQNAASHVSMATQLAEVTSIIVQWRKLELRCWNGALDIEVERCRKKASRWWFHLYTLTTDYLAQRQSEGEGDKLLESLKQFMEGSSIGEFCARVDILQAFHQHLVHTEASPQRDRLLPLLWNLHQFYNQFRVPVEEEITRLRAPVEKELKGFVKIARWSEMNYWALKASTEKTHRTVHKHARTFQGLLNQPVRGLLGDKPGDLSDRSSGPSTYCQHVTAYHQHSVQSASQQVKATALPPPDDLQPVLSGLPECSLQQKLPALCQRANKHWRSCLEALNVCEDIISLDQLTGELIQEAHELQKLDVPQGTEKDKQKAEVRHIHQRKRQALASCFQQLTSLGLSFKKGLLKEKRNHVEEALYSSPLNPAACLDKGSVLSNLWEGCDTYFTRCLSRLAQFSVALQSPSKDLGMDNIQRCQGFAEHLTVVFMTQREQLTHTFSHFVSYRKLTSAVERLTGDVFLAPHRETQQWLESIKTEVTQVTQGLTQFRLLLEACPSGSGVDVPSPFLPGDLNPMSHLQRGDELWNKCGASVQAYLDSASQVQIKLASLAGRLLFTRDDIDTLSSAMAQLVTMANGLQEMADKLNGDHDDNCLTSSITFLSASIHQAHRGFSAWMQTLTESRHMDTDTPPEADSTVAGFAGKVEGLVQSVLLSVQKLVKSGEEGRRKEEEVLEESRKAVSERGEEEMEEEEDVKDCHVVSLTEELQKHVSFLRLEKLTKSLEEVCDCLRDMTNSSSASRHQISMCSRLLLHCGPVLGLYRDMVENHVAKSLALHRTLGKMLAVMLAIFTQLALKGFCLPAEYTEEADGEGATDFVDIEGGGVGEGEGSKDVSEQIESEDQLDETKLPGEDKDKEEQQPDIAAEDNAIEMSEDFEAKPQDMEPVEGENDDEENEDKEDDDMEKQMGEVDGPESDRLDDQMWGSDEEEDKEQKEDEGPGSDAKGEKEDLVAREDDAQQGREEEEEKEKQEEKDEENADDPKVQDLQDFDEKEYDDNRTDPYHGEEDQQPEAENMDLPEDLNLDQEEQDEGEEGGEQPPGEGGEEENTELPDMAEEKTENEGTEKDGEEEQEEEKDENEGDEEKGRGEEEKETAQGEQEEEEAMDDEGKEEERGEEKEEEQKKRESAGQEECEDDEENGAETKGFSAEEKGEAVEEEEREGEEERQEKGEKGDSAGAVQDEDAENNAAGDNDHDEREGAGQTTTDQQDGHEGSSSSQLTEGAAPHDRKQTQRRPGQSREDRSLGSAEEKFRRLKTTERSDSKPRTDERGPEDQEAEMYEHITDDTSHADAQTLDVATDQQQQQQAVVGKPEEEAGDDDDVLDDDDVQMMDEEEEEEGEKREEKPWREGGKRQQRDTQRGGEEKDGETPMEVDRTEVEGSVVETLGADRPPLSTIHTQLHHLHLGATMSETDMEALRSQMEQSMTDWKQVDTSDQEAVAAAAQAWQSYETLTSSLSQDLCEQLRLILEPSQATKLKGDYRTGKRLNMRKVIPYIASQFRKDKIWLRRTKPSKRQYQIMLAIDDSSSMADNHSKQLAFESLALTANALTLLETGELGVCSFGETVQLLHPFTEPWSHQAGARVLQQFTFEQKQTRVALMLEQVTAVMLEARSKQQGWLGRPETAQLLLIVSDGRGINAEGMGVVRQAVRTAREANIFLVFVILDDPKNKNSILDIKITTFNQGKPVFRSYMEEFPFPFYVILRDINSLPQVLSDALRQWFELVTASVT